MTPKKMLQRPGVQNPIRFLGLTMLKKSAVAITIFKGLTKMWEMWDFFKNVGHILQKVGNVGPLGTLQQQLPIFRHVPLRHVRVPLQFARLILSSSSVNIFCLRILSRRRRNLKANVRIYFKIRDRLKNKNKIKTTTTSDISSRAFTEPRRKKKMCLDGENMFRVC